MMEPRNRATGVNTSSSCQSTNQAVPLNRVVVTIVALGLVEWLLFELLRAPFRPPHDMTTFLGREKYAVMAFMLALALGGFGLLVKWAASSIWTRRDVAVISLVLMFLMGAGIYVVICPGWPVTSLQWILK